jgi:release factor glutamine methyltransferase
VSNPPYITADEFRLLPPEIRLYEPYEAVVGQSVTEAIAQGARDVLRAGGSLVLECCAGKAAVVAAELQALGYDDIRITPDLTAQGRVVEGRRPTERNP